MLKVVIIDDEKIAIDELEYVLTQHEEVEVIGKYTSAKTAIDDMNELNPDVVFLDISMPDFNGFIAAEQIKEISEDINVVFVTAYDKYATKAFEIEAKDYILKPFSKNRIEMTLDRLLEKENNKSIGRIKKVNKIPVKKNNSLILIDLYKILYFVLKDGNTYIITKDEEYIIEETFYQIIKRVEDFNFIRCHRNYIVNLDYVTKILPYVNSTYLIKVKGNDEDIPVSRSYSKNVKKAFGL
ncbi:LytR/AlgR family response regulator transcription factor [Clostridium fallax]|uniref:Stage 0 sporulation protein A homolog n=1 Tax=Clostridium fallax TaxID=1533 RepID=A0A1M4WFC6_9CLOT|nr:LytTR family DNA-binding domain-containing protein [Clostridium fallax]SHE79773.1 two component transcriptional regulator, LytTR family [Clostridium fallax]SQB04936.1 LytR/AlgR family response regulator [Clostridium fallax]